MVRLALIVLVLSATPARADEPPERGPTPEPGPPTITIRDDTYAPWLLAADGVAFGMLMGAVATQESHLEPKFEDGARWTVRIGAPLVHLAHRHPVRALASLAMRFALPFAAAYLDRQIEGQDGFGFLLGTLAAVTLDAGFLATGDEHTRPIAPMIGVGGGGAIVGIGGGF